MRHDILCISATDAVYQTGCYHILYTGLIVMAHPNVDHYGRIYGVVPHHFTVAT